VLQRAQQCGIPSLCYCPDDFSSFQAYEEAILSVLHQNGIDWIVLAGYMRLIRHTLLNAYPKHIVNLHPSILPAFPGRNAIEQAYQYPVKVSGITIHYVDEGMDTGPIIAQYPVFLSNQDSLSTFKEKIHKVEHVLYPQVVEQITQEIGGSMDDINASCFAECL
jgi:phosphoribosylglycinamide formyltransferase-1